ncbi:MAG TPA: deoxyribose-phosphate aldolase [Firmicutes bacterium]|jgi:deoxyribose-phosphate aldolase|nr:deoxyribose-phosphate aldolase [Bacillota bacterium]
MQEMAAMFDSTALAVDISREEIQKLCEDAMEYGFKTVAVNQWAVPLCREFLKGSAVGITSNISYPLGAHLIAAKVAEVEAIAPEGPTELDYVINISELKAGNWDYMEREMRAITEACHKHSILCKVILETYYLTDEEIKKMCEIAREVKPDFVKTSTGQIKDGGATIEHVKLISETLVGSGVGIKPAGGIRTLNDVLAFIEAGATRIGTSAAVSIMEEYRKRFGQEGGAH